MRAKAIFFDDLQAEMRIMATTDPAEMKRVGGRIKNFDERRWDAEKEAVMFRALQAKFTQNEDLRQKLTDTGDVILAESSPWDRYWGIGLPKSRANQDPSQWKGLNRLGHLLQSTRCQLRQ
jgi:hypothetical protein